MLPPEGSVSSSFEENTSTEKPYVPWKYMLVIVEVSSTCKQSKKTGISILVLGIKTKNKKKKSFMFVSQTYSKIRVAGSEEK